MAGRDLVGYAGRWPEVTWPGGKKLAVSVVVNFEEGAEQQVGDGDPVSERMGEVISVVESGRRDQGQEQIFAYGTRAGFWRMLDALDGAQDARDLLFLRAGGRAIAGTGGGSRAARP